MAQSFDGLDTSPVVFAILQSQIVLDRPRMLSLTRSAQQRLYALNLENQLSSDVIAATNVMGGDFRFPKDVTPVLLLSQASQMSQLYRYQGRLDSALAGNHHERKSRTVIDTLDFGQNVHSLVDRHNISETYSYSAGTWDVEVGKVPRQESEENYQLIQTAFEQRLTKEGGMLLPPYQLVYEPSLSYANSSYDRIVVDGFTVYPVLVVGDIVAEKVRRDVFTNAHGFRLGLPGDFQLDLSIPLGYEEKRSFRDDGQYTEESTSGLGDISLAASYQLVNGSKFWPDTVVGLSWKTATGSDPYEQVSADEPSMGTGFETTGASLTMMAAADPAVLFGGISGSYPLGEDKSIGHVKPGAGYGFNLGMALALNFDTSLSMNYQYSHTLETGIESQKIRGSDLTASNLSIGLSRSLSSRCAVDVDVSIGLAQDTPDHQITVSFPIRFSCQIDHNRIMA